jgi:hypothetical protein
MTSSSELVAVDLTEREREFIQQALEQWALSASGKPFPFQALGLSTWGEFGELTFRLERAVKDGVPLTDLDWARVLFDGVFLCQQSYWVGSGLQDRHRVL